MNMRNIKLVIQYDGAEYRGFQRQPRGRTVQGELEKALAILTGGPVKLIGASRTDAGVHATGQVANFRSGSRLGLKRIAEGLNGILPADIRITDVSEAPEGWHARRDAVWREYEYVVWNAGHLDVFRRGRAFYVRNPLDADRLAAALSYTEGTHDFRAFCVATSADKGCIRTVHETETAVEEDGKLITIRIRANAFVHQMVRSIIGTAVEAAAGKREPESVRVLLETRDRRRAGRTAPAHGLYLTRIGYGEQ